MRICNWGGRTGLKTERDWYAPAEDGVTEVALINLAVLQFKYLNHFFICKRQAFEDTHIHLPYTHAYRPPALSLPLISHTEKILFS